MTTTTTPTTNAPVRRSVGRWLAKAHAVVIMAAVTLLTPGNLAAQATNPWEDAVDALMDAMTGPIARGLALVSIVMGGLMFAFGEGGSKKAMAGIIFGLGMALSAANFIDWLFA